MKTLWVLAVVMFVGLASPVQAQVSMPGAFVTPNGEKKVGRYVWVWRSAKIRTGQNGEIEAPCATGYVVLGGGYKIAGNGGYYGRPTASSRPSETFDGWVFEKTYVIVERLRRRSNSPHRRVATSVATPAQKSTPCQQIKKARIGLCDGPFQTWAVHGLNM
jgi:hypothetical protein